MLTIAVLYLFYFHHCTGATTPNPGRVVQLRQPYDNYQQSQKPIDNRNQPDLIYYDYPDREQLTFPPLRPNIVGSAQSESRCTNDTTIISMLLAESRYNKHQLPDANGVTVKVEFWIQEITAVSEITSDFEMDIYINEMWLDQALAFGHLNPCKQNISLSHEVFSKLWTPNSCFINSKQASIHDSPFRNIFLMIYPNGTVWANYRVKVKGPCDMDLSKFPMDVQRCSLIYESFSYNRDEVRMEWGERPDPVWPLKNFTLPDFVLTDMSNSSGNVLYPAGQWDELYATFTFERRYMWYILQAYIPTYLTIFISWISFTLGAKAIPARTMLGVNSLLAMIMMFGNIMKNLPRVSYVKAIDVWMLACMTFNFCSLLELAIIGYMTKEPAACKTIGRRIGNSLNASYHSGNSNSFDVARRQHRLMSFDNASSSLLTGRKLCRHYYPNECQFDESDMFFRPPKPNHHHLLRQQQQQETLDDSMPSCSYQQCDSDDNQSIRKSDACIVNCSKNCCGGGNVWTADRIDKASCLAFPALFSLFNVAYWSYYTQP